MLNFKIVRMIKLLALIALGLSGSACGGGGGGSGSNSETVGSGKVGGGNDRFQVSWDLHNEYSDETPLVVSDIAIYTLRFVVESGNYLVSVDINDPYITDLSGDRAFPWKLFCHDGCKPC